MNRQTFAVVVKRGERLSVAGSPEVVARLLPEHSPHAILPADWPGYVCADGRHGLRGACACPAA